DGNDDLGSIGCNLVEHPGVDRFYSVFRGIKVCPEVQDVVVAITDLMEEDEAWPFSDTVFVLTSADPAIVESWVAPLDPSEVAAAAFGERPRGLPELAPGMTVVCVWWD